jgi:hypothetical protein
LKCKTLNESNASVEGYILDHKMAVAAIAAGVGGTGVSLDASNSYSDEVKQLASALAVVAGIWALGNMDEVSGVVKTLNQADAHVRTLKVVIAQTSVAIEKQGAAIQESQNQLNAIAQQSSTLQRELNKL